MKTRKNFIALLMAVVLCFNLVGCAKEPEKLNDNGITNNLKYTDYEAWEQENKVQLCLSNVSMICTENNEESEVSTLENEQLPKSKLKKIEKLRNGIVEFFEEKYSIDVSEKMKKQQVRLFTSTGSMEETMGYVNPEAPSVLNLNQKLLNEYSVLFETSYIHESIHQLGFYSSTDRMIDEGVTDALTDMVCCYIGIEPVLTDYYFEHRTLAYQLLAADPELVACYVENDEFKITSRIDEKLKNVAQPFEKVESLGERLEMMLTAMYGLTTGRVQSYSVDPLVFVWEAQEIVNAYCQECNPKEETIDYIRSHYLITDYENLYILADMKGDYCFMSR